MLKLKQQNHKQDKTKQNKKKTLCLSVIVVVFSVLSKPTHISTSEVRTIYDYPELTESFARRKAKVFEIYFKIISSFTPKSLVFIHPPHTL